VIKGWRPDSPAPGRGEQPSEKAKKSKSARRGDGFAPREQPAPLTRQKLELMALAYVNRFDVSAAKLRQHLTNRVRKAGGAEQAAGWIAELVERYQGSGVLDDARFARNLTSQLTARGKSTRAIQQKLAQRGVSSDVTDELMTKRRAEEPGADLEAARTYVRKRKLGPYRTPEKRDEYRHKDLATLARQGFSFDIAKKALGPGSSNDDEF
jgi:regulatory protein